MITNKTFLDRSREMSICLFLSPNVRVFTKYEGMFMNTFQSTWRYMGGSAGAVRTTGRVHMHHVRLHKGDIGEQCTCKDVEKDGWRRPNIE